jgi:hypothetical protein
LENENEKTATGASKLSHPSSPFRPLCILYHHQTTSLPFPLHRRSSLAFALLRFLKLQEALGAERLVASKAGMGLEALRMEGSVSIVASREKGRGSGANG